MEFILRTTTRFSLLISLIFTFMAAVTYTAASETIAIVTPLLVWFFAAITFVLGIATTVAIAHKIAEKTAISSKERILAKNEAKQAELATQKEKIATERAAMHLMAEGRMMAATVRQIENGLIHAGQLGDTAKFSSFPQAVIKQLEAETPALEIAEQRKALLPAIAGLKNILVVGGSGTGKTELLMWLEHERMKKKNIVIVLDSHAQAGKWGGHVIGAGRDYESIATAMLKLNKELENRFKLHSDGKIDFQVTDTIIDEFTLLPGRIKDCGFDIKKYSIQQLTEGRKVGLNCVWGIHSDKVTAMGLEGASDIKECFNAIVYLKRTGLEKDGDYFAYVNFGEGIEKIKYNHPGPFTAERPTAKKPKIQKLPEPKPQSLATNKKAKPTILDLEITPEELSRNKPKRPKHDAANINAAIDKFLTDDPENFPAKGDVANAVGIAGGKYYKNVTAVYETRFSAWRKSSFDEVEAPDLDRK